VLQNTHTLGFIAIWHGLALIWKDGELRKLAVWPLVISAISYVLSVWAAISAHGQVLSWIANPNSESVWGALWYSTAWVLAALILLVLTVAVSFFLVTALSGPFQSRISAVLLIRAGIPVPEDFGLSGLAKEASRTVLTEIAKFICFLPFVLLSVISGFIPILLPVTLIIGAWLLAYRFVDVPLDVLRISVLNRLRFSLRHTVSFLTFGASLMLVWLIPLAGILLPPAAAAGATWLLLETGLIREFTQIEPVKSPAEKTAPE